MSQWKREAKKLGLDWDTVKAVFAQLREVQYLERQPEWELRQRVWELYAYSEGSLEFWRHGMQKRYARAFGEGDWTLIPRWDETAASMALEFPWLANGEGDLTEVLFELIAKPHDRLPTVAETYQEAIDRCLQMQEAGELVACGCESDVPF